MGSNSTANISSLCYKPNIPPTKRWKERPRTPSDLFRTIARTQRNPSEEGTTMHTAGHRPQNYVSRCFLRCRPPAPTETIGFPVRQQSGTKRCRKPQETIPTHPPESDDTKIRPFPRSDYKKRRYSDARRVTQPASGSR